MLKHLFRNGGLLLHAGYYYKCVTVFVAVFGAFVFYYFCFDTGIPAALIVDTIAIAEVAAVAVQLLLLLKLSLN